MKDTVLIIGKNSFLGSHLSTALEKKGFLVTAIGSQDVDLRISNSLTDANLPRFGIIFYLAAYTRAGDFCDRYPADQWVVNQLINTNAVSWWQKAQPQAKFIAMGTSASYDPQFPMREENYLKGIPHEKYLSYAMSKRMLFTGQLAMNKQFGLKYLHLIPSTIFGPNYHTDGRPLHFIYDIICKLLKAKYKNEKAILWGNGHQRRELVYINDIVTDMIFLAENTENTTINISSGKDFSIRELVGMLCNIIDFPESEVDYDTNGFVGAENKNLDIARLQSLIPERKSTDLTDALRMTVSWSKEHLI